MLVVARKPDKAEAAKKRRNVLFVTLDDETESALQAFIEAQRIKPDRAAVGFAALVELLEREGFPPYK